MLKLQKNIRKKANKKSAQGLMRFFKTEKGQYGYGDKFLGCWTTPEMQEFARSHQDLSLNDLSTLMKSPYHEERSLALEILELQYKKKSNQKEIVKFYLKHKKGINNWDLVDMSAYNILGHYCQKHQNKDLILKLSSSNRHWDKRIAMVSTLAFIRQKELDLTFFLAKKFLNETEDLMHKACGWMLREAGKRDIARLLAFIKTHGKSMPRTMLRYSIEKLPLEQRKAILLNTK